MSTIRLNTAIPGPKSEALSERRAKAVPRGLSHGTPIYVAKAEDAWLEDVDGNRYLDFAGGIGCLNVGHRQETVVKAVKDQLDRFLHTCVQVTPYESYVRLAERMNEVTPGKFAKKTIFVNSGAEAVENAVKIARAYTKRPGIIAFEDAFHGRTMMTLALTSKTHPYKAGFAPFPGEVYRVPFSYCYRCSYNLKYPSCDLYCARHLEDTFKRVVANEEVAAVIAEPVLGEGGFIAPPPDYFKVLIDLCHKHGILFIADEVQSGFGRTGALFASERYGIEPDLHRHREISRRRLATRGRHRPRGNHGCSRRRWPGRNVRRKSALVCGGSRGTRLVRAREFADARQRTRRAVPAPRPRMAAPLAHHRRCART